MKRRKTGRKTAKARVRTRRNAPKAGRRPAVVDSDTPLARLKHERDEALHQQAATAEILKLVANSPADTQPVFEAIVQSGLKLFPDAAIFIALPDGDRLRAAAFAATNPAHAKVWRTRWPIPLRREYMHSAAFLDRKIVDVPDAREPPPKLAVGAKNFLPTGYRAVTIVPLMRGRTAIGTLSVVRLAPGKLSKRQVAALKSYAAQAVIAIENTRLLNELRQRTDDLSESLEQQTATSEVLQVVSKSPGDLEPVFQSMLENAVRLCEAKFGVLFRYEEGEIRHAAMLNVPAAHADSLRQRGRFRPESGHPLGRLLKTKKLVHTIDASASANPPPSARLGGARTHVAVPMLKDDELIGAIVIYRQEVRPFTDKQIELVKNFAAQAVIAIENTRLLSELRHRTDDLSESLEQQTAMSKVLEVISRSAFDLQPVFETVVESAVKVCGADKAFIFRFDGELLRMAAAFNAPPEFQEWVARNPIRPGRHSGSARAALERRTIHIHDVQADPEYSYGAKTVENIRTILGVPILKGDELLGVIMIYRLEVSPFTDKQIALVETFADQAAIAIENTRLFETLQQRTNDLTESLQQQTATADVLKIISGSTFDLSAVLSTLVESAVRLCDGFDSVILLREDQSLVLGAHHGPIPIDFDKWPLTRKWTAGRAVIDGQPVHVHDLTASGDEFPEGHAMAVRLGHRTILSVPLLREKESIGCLTVRRSEVRPFSEKQIELVGTFADQAVIAIENARLLSELRESLQQQTATADVLKVISSSPGNLEPVFEGILESATQICQAGFGTLNLYEDNAFRSVALHNPPPQYRARLGEVIHPHPDSGLAHVARTKQIAHIEDVRTQKPYLKGSPAVVGLADLAGARTLLIVPMLKEGNLLGAVSIYRQEIRPFTDKQIELVQNFAAQAVIAIENARLLSELRESLQQQTATSDVLKVISRSTFDLPTVLQTLVESAATLCDADKTNITRQRDGAFYRAEAHGFSREFMDYVRNIPIAAERGSAFGRALLEGRAVHIPDVTADADYTSVDLQRLGDYRTVLAVPMLREGTAIGVLTLTRSEVRPFTAKQIELASTFADQAAIAIENVRLFDEVQGRTRELARSLEDLRTTQDRLVQTQKLASLGQLTAGIAHEIKNPLNFVNNFSAVSGELIDDLQDALKGIPFDDKVRGEVDELTTTLRGNLDKVVQHGKRADSIVKNMLLHSREGSGEHRIVDINAIVEESLNLAYHGARAEKQGFNVTLERSFDARAGEADLFPQEITRVLLNLISNGFYATTKRNAEGSGNGYEPTLMAATKDLGDSVEIRIRDNGTGMPPEVKEKIFNPFFTTKPAGEGTGLGLSLSHDIVVKQHGGSIEVDTRPGEFTEFRVILPRSGATLAKTE